MSRRIKIRIMLLVPMLLALFFSYTPAQSNATYYPEGPQQNVSKQTLIDSGWTLCWEDYYSSYNNLENIFSQCNGTHLIYAGGLTGSDSYLLIAAGERSAMLTQTGHNQTTLNNGTYWYYSSGWGSIGFAPNSTIQQSSADVYDGWGGTTGHLRLSWHSDGTNIFGGWRVGMIVGLNGSTEYQRAIWQTNGAINAQASPTPTETATPEPTLTISPEPSPSETPTETPSPTPSPSETLIPSPEPTPSPIESQTQAPAPSQPNPTPTPVVIPDVEEELEIIQEPIEEPEPTLEPSPEPTPFVIEEIIPVEEQISNTINEVLEEEITSEQLNNIAELLLENYEIDEPMPVAELLEELNDEQVLELLEQLDPNQEIEYIDGVILEAGVAAIFVQLADPAALFNEVLSDPAQVLEAFGQLGADMTEEQREQSEEVVVAAVIVSQLIGSVAAMSTVTQINARAEIRRIV